MARCPGRVAHVPAPDGSQVFFRQNWSVGSQSALLAHDPAGVVPLAASPVGPQPKPSGHERGDEQPVHSNITRISATPLTRLARWLTNAIAITGSSVS